MTDTEVEMSINAEERSDLEDQFSSIPLKNIGRVILLGASNVDDLEDDITITLGGAIEVLNCCTRGIAATESGYSRQNSFNQQANQHNNSHTNPANVPVMNFNGCSGPITMYFKYN